MLMSVLLLPACQSMQTVAETNANHVSNNIQRDSVYLHDSVSYTYRPAKISLPYREGAGVGSPPDTVSVTLTVTKTDMVEKPYVPSFYKYCATFAILFVLYVLIRLALYIAKHYYL